MSIQVYFSDFFDVDPTVIEAYGAFNISFIGDLPLFIDPFLLFESEKEEYRELHDSILQYVAFLRDKAIAGEITDGLFEHWFLFPEVKQNWFGYSELGNYGSGLGRDFGKALQRNLNTVFADFGQEKISKGSHLEKLCLIKSGVGRDNISDFTTNLIKNFLLEYTEKFSTTYLQPEQRGVFSVQKAYFSYTSERWLPKKYVLPKVDGDYVILTPKDILTKDENWINSRDIIQDFPEISQSIPNAQLRDAVNNYFALNLPKPEESKRKKKAKAPSKKDIAEAVRRVVEKYPEFLDYYIKYKEDNGEQAKSISKEKVSFSESIFIERIQNLIEMLSDKTLFYQESENSIEESLRRVHFLKDVIENNNGYRIFYVDGEPIKREKDIQVMFRLTWFATSYDVNSEVDNGRGPVDYKISKGRDNSTLVEFKLASNKKLKQNLQHQVEVYKKANKTDNSIKVILYFSDEEYSKTNEILRELNIDQDKHVILIDARRDNKISASNVTQIFYV